MSLTGTRLLYPGVESRRRFVFVDISTPTTKKKNCRNNSIVNVRYFVWVTFTY